MLHGLSTFSPVFRFNPSLTQRGKSDTTALLCFCDFSLHVIWLLGHLFVASVATSPCQLETFVPSIPPAVIALMANTCAPPLSAFVRLSFSVLVLPSS